MFKDFKFNSILNKVYYKQNVNAMTYFIQKSESVKLKKAYVDLRTTPKFEGECHMKHLTLDEATFYPPKHEDSVNPIKMSTFEALGEECNFSEKFEDLTDPNTLKSINCSGVMNSSYVKSRIINSGSKLTALKDLRIN